MPTSDQEIEQTLKQSKELSAKSEALVQQALAADRELGPLFAAAGKEFERLDEVINTTGTKPGTGIECLVATVELIGDWAQFETVAIEAMDGKARAPANVAPSRPGLRRGMRI
jgi:hypothetical protein